MKIMKMYIGNTFSNRKSQIKYSETDGIKETIKTLKSIIKYSPDEINNLDEILWVLENTEVLTDAYSAISGSTVVYIDNLNVLFEHISIQRFDMVCDTNKPTIFEIWHIMLRNLSDDIDDMYRYGYKDTDDTIIFLRALLEIFTNSFITDDYVKFRFMVEE